MVQHQSKAAKQSKLDEGSKYVIVFYCGYLREISWAFEKYLSGFLFRLIFNVDLYQNLFNECLWKEFFSAA